MQEMNTGYQRGYKANGFPTSNSHGFLIFVDG